MPAVYFAVLLSALALLCSVFSFFFYRSYLRRRTGHERILAELREEVEKILRSIDETTDRDISLIEEREKNLKTVLSEVDKRLRIYIRELEKSREDELAHAAISAKAKAATYQELGKNRYRIAAMNAADENNAPDLAVIQTRETDVSTTAAGEITAPSLEGQNASPPVVSPLSQLSLPDQVRELARAGFAPQVIASHLGLSIAEVEVVTALMERRDD